MTQLKRLSNLIEKYNNNLSYYRSTQYNETQLRTDFLDIFFSILGWDLTNTSGKMTNEREVLVEESLKLNAGENTKKPDYTFRLFSERKFFVEAKKPSVHIETDPIPAKQVRRYGFTAKLKISVLSNFEYTAIYDCSNQVGENDSVTNSRVKLYHYTELIEKFDEIQKLIGKESVYDGCFDNEWAHIEDKISYFSVDDLFLQQINSWRLMLANKFITIKTDLTEESLNDLTQKYINSLVFLRVCEDRDLEDFETLHKLAQEKNYRSLIKKLQDSDRRYNSGLFALPHIDEFTKNGDSCFWDIIEQLYFPQSTYSFSVLSSDILGNIYEIFLSEKVRISQNGILEIQPKEEHLDRDIVTTPTHIVKEIVRHTVIEYCKDKTDEQILNSTFADIACGSGAFLIEVFQTLQDILTDYYIKHNHSKLEQITKHRFKLKLSVKKSILTQCIYGIDKDFNAVKACSFGLLLKLIEDESRNSVGQALPILPIIDNNILFGNSLIDLNDNVENENLLLINPLNIEKKFDVIVGNPPYMATEHMKQLTPLEVSIYKSKYKSAFKQFDKYFLFIERSISLLKENGYLGYIIPSKFTKVGAGAQLRKLLIDKKILSQLIFFGSHQVFKGRTTYTCLLILKNSLQNTFQFYEVKNFKKWLTREHTSLKTSTYETNKLSADTWILEHETNVILKKVFQICEPLGEILGSNCIQNGIQTSANNYYIHKEIKTENGYIYFEYNGEINHIEKELTRPYFETQRSGQDVFYTYKNVEPNAFVIYPYKKTDDRILLVEYEDLRENYPKMFKFLNSIKIHLNSKKRSVLPTPTTPNEWYRYGRSQALDNCDVPQKIIVGILSNGYKYSIDNDRTFVSSGGTAGYSIINIPDTCSYSIYYIQALLSSKYLEWFASLYGEVFRGGFIARGTKVQTRMPIPKIDFNDITQKDKHDNIANVQQEMNLLYTQISTANDRSKIALNRKFEKNREKLDSLIMGLFNLGELDKLIPTIQELYNT